MQIKPGIIIQVAMQNAKKKEDYSKKIRGNIQRMNLLQFPVRGYPLVLLPDKVLMHRNKK